MIKRKKKLEKLEEKVKENSKDKKKKKEKTLFEKLFNKKKLNRPEKVAVIYLRTNRTAEPIEAELKDSMFMIHGKSYDSKQECIWITTTKERYPLAVIHEDQITPVGTKEWSERAIQQKFQEFQDHVIKAIRHTELVREGYKGEKTNFSTKQIVGAIIAAVIIGAILTNYL